jgi:hypothetical protein
MRDCCRVNVTSGGTASKAGSMGTIEASGRFIISLSSFVVKDASNGPRLPTMDTCLTAERERLSRTDWGISYFDKEAGGRRSILATSKETFPCPIRVT